MIPWIIISFFSTILTFSLSIFIFHISVLSSYLLEIVFVIIILTIQSYCIGFVIAYFAVLKNNIKTTFYMFSIIQFFSGYIYLVDYIPVPLRYLVYVNPFFYGIDGFRQLLQLDYFLDISLYSKLGLVSFITVILVLGVKIISSKNWKWDNA